uniref:GCR004 n=1 Tax=Schmidtea mediterranea TaxID=79327 RepID=A0A193KUF1_SCHMD|nr:GCR004 [Schmidtea mediterranea]
MLTFFEPFNASISSNKLGISSQIIAKCIKTLLLSTIIAIAIFGNGLVIVSVLRFHKLRRIITNRFVVSLALADLLVSCCVMTFSASMVASDGLWLFGPFLCDLFNANDVLFSTASIAHLASISMDRYISIKMPFQYNQIMTSRKSILMLIGCWIYALVVSYIPIFTGLYSSAENFQWQKSNPTKCEFRVNPFFGIGSSIISFWIPCIVMTIVYGLIYKDARKQENQIFQMQKRTFSHGHRSSVKCDHNSINLNDKKKTLYKEERIMLQKEHKAAKTLGIIMGVFIVCWLPFFLWMTIKNACLRCPELHPILVDTLFWIGYFNSTLNPAIYAFYQQDFRRAFKIQLKSCCCIFQRAVCCLKSNRNSLTNSYEYYTTNSAFSRRKPNTN